MHKTSILPAIIALTAGPYAAYHTDPARPYRQSTQRLQDPAEKERLLSKAEAKRQRKAEKLKRDAERRKQGESTRVR